MMLMSSYISVVQRKAKILSLGFDSVFVGCVSHLCDFLSNVYLNEYLFFMYLRNLTFLDV